MRNNIGSSSDIINALRSFVPPRRQLCFLVLSRPACTTFFVHMDRGHMLWPCCGPIVGTWPAIAKAQRSIHDAAVVLTVGMALLPSTSSRGATVAAHWQSRSATVAARWHRDWSAWHAWRATNLELIGRRAETIPATHCAPIDAALNSQFSRSKYRPTDRKFPRNTLPAPTNQVHTALGTGTNLIIVLRCFSINCILNLIIFLAVLSSAEKNYFSAKT